MEDWKYSSSFTLHPLSFHSSSFILHPSLKLSPTNADCNGNDTDEYRGRWRIVETRLGVYLHPDISNFVCHSTPDVGAKYVISLCTDDRIDRHKAVNTSRDPPLPFSCT